MKNKIVELIIIVILILTPLAFAKTVYNAWFGEQEFINQLKKESLIWFFIFIAELLGFLALLPARNKARLMQFICAISATLTGLFFLAIIIR